MITIVDYDAGNIRSIMNMLRFLGVASHTTKDPADVAAADKLILPGVGHFDYGMRSLADHGLIEPLQRRVIEEGAPILGICLGAQLFTRGSEEGSASGLGWVDGRCMKFDRTRMGEDLRVPHMGWTETWSTRESPLTANLPADARFYYVHSYHLVCNEPADVILSARYGYEFVAGFQRGNVFGVQFHPEKSHRFGMDVLRNFSALPVVAARSASATV